MTDPTVSVVMAAYNGAALIGATVESLRAQTFGDWELIVVDDCSQDATRDVVAAVDDPRVRLIANQDNVGPVRARNRAFEAARGRYIAGLDQDDLCHPERFARQVALLDARPEVVLVATAANEIHGEKVIPSQLPPATTPALIEWLLQVQNPLVWSSAMFRADAARGWPEMTRPDYRYAEDFDLYHRLSRVGRITRIDKELITYRVHAGGASAMFVETMTGNAARVLAEAYAGLLPDPAQAARDVVDYVMERRPVPDGDTLRRLGATIGALQAHFLKSRRPDRESQWLIRWETARIWARVGRAALRSGAVGLADRLGARPDHLGLGHADPGELIVSGLIGAARRNRRKRSRA